MRSLPSVDLDAFVAAHRQEWRRLSQLVARARRPRRLSGAEADELVSLYQRAAAHLSVVRSSGGDPALVARLSQLVARGRAAATGVASPTRAAAARFVVETLPAAIWRARWWWAATSLACLALSAAIALWVGTHPEIQAAIAAPEDVRRLVERDFADYYSSSPAGSFAARVWSNNAWIAAGAISLGVLLGLPTLYLLWSNSLNIGIAAGLLGAHDRLGLFFGLVSPHGLLELSAVFLAGGVGLRLGWTIVDPGARTRAGALAEETRGAVVVATGLVAALAVAGGLEAFITPSGLPTWARVGVGALVWAGFLGYVLVLGRRAAARGVTGDLTADERGDAAPIAG